MSNDSNMDGAAIVCPFIAAKKLPVIYAVRDEPVDPADSGWQFLSKEQVDVDGLKVWLLREVLEYEPSLRAFMNVSVGTKLWRESASDAWMIKTSADDDWRDAEKRT